MRSQLGLYRPGNSWLHQLPAGAKLLALIVLGAIAFWLRTVPLAALIGLVIVIVLFASAGFKPGVMWAQIRPMIWVLLFTGLLYLWSMGSWQQAIALMAMLATLALAAALVTLTTRTADLVEVIVNCARPFERFGVDAERIGLTMLLGIRCVPLVAGLAAGVRDAQIARGNTRSWRAFAVPLLVTALRSGQSMGEALIARGADD